MLFVKNQTQDSHCYSQNNKYQLFIFSIIWNWWYQHNSLLMSRCLLRKNPPTPRPAQARLQQKKQNLFMSLNLCSMEEVSLTLGKSSSGTGRSRNWQSGPQPSFTWKTRSLSGGISRSTCSRHSVKNLKIKTLLWMGSGIRIRLTPDSVNISTNSHITALIVKWFD